MKLFHVFSFMFYLSVAHTQGGFQSFESVKLQSVAENKPILLVFSGSDWCKPCIQLKKEILDSEDFRKEQENFIFLYLDFPYKKKNIPSKEVVARNETLAERYNQSGYFPYVVLLDGEGKLLTHVPYTKDVDTNEFIKLIKMGYEK